MRLFQHLSFLLALSLTGGVMAQEGHPLKGSWIGEWSGNETHGEFVLLVLDWDGNEVTGIINPGTDNIEIDSVELDPSDWTVSITAQDYEIEGTIEELELPSRSINGTWESQDGSGDFAISRQ